MTQLYDCQAVVLEMIIVEPNGHWPHATFSHQGGGIGSIGGRAGGQFISKPTQLLMPPRQMTIMVVLPYDNLGGRLQSVPIIVLISVLKVCMSWIDSSSSIIGEKMMMTLLGRTHYHVWVGRTSKNIRCVIWYLPLPSPTVMLSNMLVMLIIILILIMMKIPAIILHVAEIWWYQLPLHCIFVFVQALVQTLELMEK